MTRRCAPSWRFGHAAPTAMATAVGLIEQRDKSLGIDTVADGSRLSERMRDMSDNHAVKRTNGTIEFVLEVDDQFGPSVWDVRFVTGDKSAEFSLDQANHVHTGATSPDDLTHGWVTWAAANRVVMAYALPYIGDAGWAVMPIDRVADDDDAWWQELARTLLKGVALANSPAANEPRPSDHSDARQAHGRAYTSE